MENKLEVAENVINDFLKNNLFPPKKNWPGWDFEKRSVEIATVKMILEEIKKSGGNDPKKIIYWFVLKFDKMYEKDFSHPFSHYFIFSREVSKELYYLFC